MAINLEALFPVGEDSGLPKNWKFDPANPPDHFTVPMIRRLSVRQLKELSDPENVILDEKQQASFDAAYKDWWAPIRAQLAQSSKVLNNTMRAQIAPELSGSMERLREKVRAQTDFSQHFRDAGIQLDTPNATRRGTSPADDLSGRFPEDIDDQATAAAYERGVDESSDQVALLQSMATMMEQQHLSSTRGAFFALLVSVAVIVAGVAPVVAARSWAERGWIALWTLVICAVAGAGYAVVRSLETRGTEA